MDLIDRLREIASRAKQMLEHLHTEEATKTALIMPFIQALGYNVFDPTEVVPEFVSDVGTKKGEKVDYAIFHNGTLSILVECKVVGSTLDINHASQLYRYFSVTGARIGILSDGLTYKFFSDLERPNCMDERPFFEFNLIDFTEQQVDELRKFSRELFDIDNTLASAADLKYLRGIKRVLTEEWMNPSEEFVRLLAGRVYSGNITQSVRQQFTEIIHRAFQRFINERINERLKSAMATESPRDAPKEDIETSAQPDEGDSDVVTTDEEIEGFYIAKAIVSQIVDPRRVFMRDTHSYCGVLLDDNNRKPICRLRFNAAQKKYVGVFDEQKQETKHEIENINDLFKHAEVLRNVVLHYDRKPADAENG